MMRAIVPLMATLLLLPGATAQFDELEFTVLMEDPQDFAGFYDMLELAVAEPGNGSLVMRFTSADATTSPSGGSINFFFSAGGANYAMGPGADGEPDANANINEQVPDWCNDSAAPVYYCGIALQTLGVGSGDTISDTYAISYAGVAQDYMPVEGGFATGTATSARGSDYVITGNTNAALPDTLFFNRSGTSVQIENTFDNATDTTYVYNWTDGPRNATLSFAANITNGSVQVTVEDAAGAVVHRSSVTNSTVVDENITAAPGNWTIRLQYGAFVGTSLLEIEPSTPESNETATETTTATMSNGTGTTTQPFPVQQEEESPASAALLVVALAAAVALRRRS